MILFIGVAGAGKSVQGKHLSDLLGFPWISTGELLRMHISGEKRQRMLRGELLTDEELYEIVEPILKELMNESQIILDGFPRTLAQAQWLEQFVEKNGTPISCIIHLDVPKEIAIERLMKRGRPDDTEEALTRRFDEYRRVTLPILEYYEKLGIPSPLIDGSGSEDEVRERITKAVTELGIHKA
ncbi:MAG TPA: nucleoside monophosphate kinase [Candidatus Saccharibacteria bacterium]|nr:nucleoside monophosphate kinase [Candidatus Saccharibacteria bacterium]